jgi:hypothetical protein
VRRGGWGLRGCWSANSARSRAARRGRGCGPQAGDRVRGRVLVGGAQPPGGWRGGCRRRSRRRRRSGLSAAQRNATRVTLCGSGTSPTSHSLVWSTPTRPTPRSGGSSPAPTVARHRPDLSSTPPRTASRSSPAATRLLSPPPPCATGGCVPILSRFPSRTSIRSRSCSQRPPVITASCSPRSPGLAAVHIGAGSGP